MVASAKGYLDKNDSKAAIIQLKNALQKKPDSGEARFLLGKALLATGNASGAEVELKKALELQYDASRVLPLLARALLAQGQQDALLTQYADKDLSDPAAAADLKTTIAAAYASRGKFDAAEQAIAQALKAMPDFLPARLSEVRLKAVRKDVEGAIALLDDLVLKHPQSDEAWQLKADFLLGAKGDPKGALEAYQKAATLKPDNVGAHSGVLGILFAQKDMAAVEAQLAAFKKAAPNQPQVKYFEALLAYEKRDFKVAKELVDPLLKMAPENPRVLQLAGLIELQGKGYVQAETYLGKSLQLTPAHEVTRRLLAQTYLQSGQLGKAQTTIQPLLEKTPPDAESQALAGEIYLRSGDSRKADAYFLKAAELNPKDARSRTALAVSQLAKGGDVSSALDGLRQVAASDPGIVADMALVSAYWRRGEVDAAIKATAALERKQPDQPLASEIRGRIYLAQKNFDAARKSFEKALQISPTYLPAVISLAALDLADKKFDDAKKRFDGPLAADPKNTIAIIALAQLRVKSGASKEEVTGLLANAIKQNPTASPPRLVLIEYQLGNKDVKQALATAQDAAASLPQNPEVLEALGQVQQISGDLNQAATAFGKLVALQPQSPQAHMRLAAVQMAQKDPEAALQSLRRALSAKPDFLPAQRALIQTYLASNKFKEAQLVIRSVQSQRPAESVGYQYEGDAEAAQKHWDAAASAYKTALEKAASPELAIQYHMALQTAKNAKEADRFSGAWLKNHPTDAAFYYYLGDTALGRGDYAQAEGHYQSVKRLRPDNAAALNNIAWLMLKLKKPGALAYAEQANKLQPDQPSFLDTMALVLLEDNKLNNAVEVQKKAVALQPENGGFRLNLAKIYIKSGQKSLAKAELEQLSKLGSGFKAQEEVDLLLKSL